MNLKEKAILKKLAEVELNDQENILLDDMRAENAKETESYEKKPNKKVAELVVEWEKNIKRNQQIVKLVEAEGYKRGYQYNSDDFRLTLSEDSQVIREQNKGIIRLKDKFKTLERNLVLKIYSKGAEMETVLEWLKNEVKKLK